MPWPLILDALLAVLLAVTIGYAIVLNRKLTELRRGRSELERTTADFQQAAIRADNGVGKLKLASEQLQDRIDGAKSLCDDLGFLIERAGTAADRLERSVRSARTKGEPAKSKPIAPPTVSGAREPLNRAFPQSEAERRLLDALRADRQAGAIE